MGSPGPRPFGHTCLAEFTQIEDNHIFFRSTTDPSEIDEKKVEKWVGEKKIQNKNEIR